MSRELAGRVAQRSLYCLRCLSDFDRGVRLRPTSTANATLYWIDDRHGEAALPVKVM
jgi:hypothetical protein